MTCILSHSILFYIFLNMICILKAHSVCSVENRLWEREWVGGSWEASEGTACAVSVESGDGWWRGGKQCSW